MDNNDKLTALVATFGADGITVSTNAAYDDGVARVACNECRAWSKTDQAIGGVAAGEIRHAKSCESRPQIPSVAKAHAALAAKERRNSLERFAANVRRTGLTLGRDADVAECVRLGLLTENHALNTDD